MSACAERWIAALESIAEDYCFSDQMPVDFEDAMKRMVGMGLNRDEAETMLREAKS